MLENQRFTLMAIALFCVTCAGTTLTLVSITTPVARSVHELPSVHDIRPSLAPEPVPATREMRATRRSRLTFMRPDILAPEITEGNVGAIANRDTWSVEVNQPPITSTKSQRATSKTGARRAAKSRYTLKQRLAEISPTAMGRVAAKFEAAKADWPPAEIAFVAIKDENALEVYARPQDGVWKYVHRYKVLAASGVSGPKLKRGDKQVPEGIYRISYLNPNSRYHVSLRVNYPNAFDRKMAVNDGRKDLGGDIMIHGKNVSAGCLAVGDKAVEELFVLAAEVGIRNIKVVIAPTDFRRKKKVPIANGLVWTPKLYAEIANSMKEFKAPQPLGLLSLLGL